MIKGFSINKNNAVGIDSSRLEIEWDHIPADSGVARVSERLTGKEIWKERFEADRVSLALRPPLRERTPYRLALSFYDGDGRLLAEDEGFFSTGLFEGQLSFEYAKWISAYEKDEIKTHKNTSGWGTWGENSLIDYDPRQDVSYLYAKDVALEKKPVYAQANICSLGYHELYVNGKKAGDRVLEPGFTGFDKRALYSSYDVTALLEKENRFTVMLGNGLYNSSCIDTWGFHNARWRGNTKFIMLTDIFFEDGEHIAVVSDGDFVYKESYITYQNIRSGEKHDMRLKELAGAYSGSLEDWEPVFVHAFEHPHIEAQKQPAIKERGEIRPCGLAGTENDLWVKFPVNMTGWAEIRLRGRRGQAVRLEFRERGPYDWRGKDVGFDEPHITALVEGGFQRWDIILSGEEDVCRPKFAYYGFQYIHITGLGYVPSLADIKGIQVNTALEPAGHFRCSWKRGQQLHDMAVRTYLNNFHSVPTDCPHREKNGWTADGWMAAEYGMLNFDGREAYKKWLRDMADDQYPDGSMSGIVPNPDWEINNMRLFDTQWTGAAVALLYYYTRYYEDTELIKEMWPVLIRFMDYAESKMTGRLYEEGSLMPLGDWLEIPGEKGPRTDLLFCNTFFMYILNKYMRELADRAGFDPGRFTENAQKIKEAVNRRYLREDGTYFEDSQTSLILGLLFDFIPEDKRPLALAALEKSLKNGFNVGLTGTKYLFDCLSKEGRDKLVKELLDRDAYPSYGHMLKNGATTVWESWDGGASHDHPMLGVYDAWLYKAVGALDYAAGRLEVNIPPRDMGIEWAEADYDSVYGRISVRYRYKGDTLTAELQVPEGVWCRLSAGGKEPEYLPGGAYLKEYRL